MTESSLDQPLKLSLKARPLGVTVEDFVGAAGALYQRTRLVDDSARFASTTGADKPGLVDALNAYASPDPGLDEARALLARWGAQCARFANVRACA